MKKLSLMCIALMGSLTFTAFSDEASTEIQKKMDAIKYPSKDFVHGMKLYKHITSGVSLQWFILETLQKKGEIECVGAGEYCLVFKTSAYPNVDFTFSSNDKMPKFKNRFHIREFSDYEQIKNQLDLKGVLFEIENSLPGNIDSRKIFQKFCKEYPQIKPTFVKPNNNSGKTIRQGGYQIKMRIKNGKYLWKDDNVNIAFSFMDSPVITVTGPDPNMAAMLKRQFAEMSKESPCFRKVSIQDVKLFKRLVASKLEQADAAEKAKKDAAQNAALDF